MKKILYILTVLVAFTQCNPKVGETVSTPDPITTTQLVDEFRKSVPSSGPSPVIKLGEYKDFVLENGLRVIVVENHKIPQVSFQLYVDNPKISQGENTGYIELTGELLSRGSTTKTKADLDEEIDFMGASFYTSENGFFASSLTKYTDNLLNIASDAVLNPSFSQKEFEKIVTQKKSELASNKEESGIIASNVAKVLNYGKDHPYGNITTEKTLANVNLDMCKEYYTTYFKPNVSYIVVVGDITPNKALEKVKKYFSSWEKADIPQVRYSKINEIEKTTIDFVNKSNAVQSEIKVTYPIDLNNGTKEAIHASITNTILGGYFRSRLNQNLREDHAYTYGIYSGLKADPIKGYFTTKGSVRNEVTDSAIVQIILEMNDLKNGNITDKELTTVKNVIAGKFGRNLEKPETLAKFALNTFKYNLPKDYYHNYLKTLNNASLEDIKASAQKFINPDKAHIIVVGNKKDVYEDLKVLSQIGEVNQYDAYGNQMEDKPKKELPKLEGLLGFHYEALGGIKNIENITSIISNSKAEVRGMTLTMDYKINVGKQFRMTLSMMGNPMQELVYSNGKGVTKMQGQTIPMKDEELSEMQNETYVTPLYQLYNNYSKGEVTDIESIDGNDAYGITIKHSEGNSTMYYIDAKTYMLVKVTNVTTEEGKPVYSNTLFSNYEETENVMMPYSVFVTGPGNMPVEFKISNYEINKDIPESEFKLD